MNEDLFLYGALNIFLKLDNCNIYKKTMNCSITKEKLEEILKSAEKSGVVVDEE